MHLNVLTFCLVFCFIASYVYSYAFIFKHMIEQGKKNKKHVFTSLADYFFSE